MSIIDIKIFIIRKIAYLIHYGIYNTRLGRNKYVIETTLEYKLKHKQPLTSQEKKEIRETWKSIMPLKKIDWDFFATYEGIIHPTNISFYIPDSIWYRYIDLFLTNPRKSYAVDDKNFYEKYYNDVSMPRTICRMIGGILQSPNYESITLDAAINICKNEKQIVIKRSVCSEGGKGITFWNSETDSEDTLLKLFRSEQNLIVQEIVSQHESLAKLHPMSLNTIRIMTLLIDNEVRILSSVVRMGVGKSKVDNASSGGIVCGIKENGQLRDFAYDIHGNIYHDTHPQGCRFEEIIVPNFDSCVVLVKDLALRMCGYSKLISWDLAIDQFGKPKLIESNLTFGQLDFHQLCNGPILGTDTNFINRVFAYVERLKKDSFKTLAIMR